MDFLVNLDKWLLLLLVNFTLTMAIYKFYGRLGLFCWIPISTILANIQVIMFVRVFGMEATLGNILYATSFLVTDIISENYGDKEAKKAVGIGFFSLITALIVMQIALSFEVDVNNPDAMTNYEAVSRIFGFLPRLALASLTAYLVSQRHDVFAYAFWKKKFPGEKYIFIRNNMSTLVSQLLDTSIFVSIAFVGILPSEIVFQIFYSTYIIKFIVGALDTPFVYLAKHLKDKKQIAEG